ncbi:hypothetical protein YS40_135 [Thermus phage phiYS40]|uniref:hypothetical protein n=1 Tax=Thermus phage phiYS40 TaxID=407392 RepID=UPI0000E689FD|nr:hypothetical protein YS40_135 [Thermus phage phiYS40]ABJ91529.1 hypothetical protein YS40_135 [Thermus phage phiYS40]BAK53653.1 hypothetical protein YSP_135 [Thermus phage phiYS40]
MKKSLKITHKRRSRMRKELLFYNKDLGEQRFLMKNCAVSIYRRIDFSGLTNELFNQRKFVSEDFEAAKKFLAKTFKEIKKENLDVVIANDVEIEVQGQKKKRIKNLTNFLGSNKEFIEDVSEVDLSKMISERIEKIIENSMFKDCIYENKTLKISFAQRIVASFKNKTIPFPEKYVIWFLVYFERKKIEI